MYKMPPNGELKIIAIPHLGSVVLRGLLVTNADCIGLVQGFIEAMLIQRVLVTPTPKLESYRYHMTKTRSHLAGSGVTKAI